MPFMLLIMPDKTNGVDSHEVEKILRQSIHTSDFNLASSKTVDCGFTINGHKTLIDIYRDGSGVLIDGNPQASMEAVIEIAQSYPHPLRLIDEGYTFDIDLSKIGSVADLEKRVTEGCYDSFE